MQEENQISGILELIFDFKLNEFESILYRSVKPSNLRGEFEYRIRKYWMENRKGVVSVADFKVLWDQKEFSHIERPAKNMAVHIIVIEKEVSSLRFHNINGDFCYYLMFDTGGTGLGAKE